ncbi:chorismate mutase [Bifidobacterium xylocopae]|uniref:Chorismate mutase n=1 Tax=Bifidobacterium xylocopae TaxID=2493119 RepID=A0A366KC88_9BIFI|nr:chorismate mutase [Bifidobacterium xylocopae]RBP98852.1 chorismate mutase [Bifidobacterium xylocopae]
MVSDGDGLNGTVIGSKLGASDSGAAAAERIRRLRGTIDNLDAAVIRLLAERFKVTGQVGELKAQAGFAPADPAREGEQLEELRTQAVKAGLDPRIAELYHAFVAGQAKEGHARIARRQRAEA